MMIRKKIFPFFIFIFLVGNAGAANRFANQFVAFELPAKWKCILEGAEWVCQSLDESKKKDAIIIMAAKLKGTQDTLDQYYQYLNQPKVYQSVTNQAVKSEVRYTKNNKFNEHNWVDALHLESEIPGFYTRYLATIKEDIGVLVTFSVAKDKYSQYQTDMKNLVETLQVFRKPGLNALSQEGSLFKTGTGSFISGGAGVAPPSQVLFPQTEPAQRVENAPKKKSDDTLFLIIILGALGFLFILWKKKQNTR